MKKSVENLLEISTEHGTNKPCICRTKNINMAPWIEAPTAKATARHESAKENKLKNFVKDCKNCRKLTKNCTYSCRNQMKFTHHDDVSKYMRDYHATYSTTGHVTHQTRNSVATKECIDTLPVLYVCFLFLTLFSFFFFVLITLVYRNKVINPTSIGEE